MSDPLGPGGPVGAGRPAGDPIGGTRRPPAPPGGPPHEATRRPTSRRAPRRAPPRRGPGPLLVLAVIALIPAVGLLVVFRWADGEVPDEDAVPPPSSTLVAPPLPPDPLSNDVWSFRRLPNLVSLGLNVEQFVADTAPFLATLNERSCVAISVDGIPIGARNPTVPVIPASTEKLVVAAVALDVLGDDFRYRTAVVAPPGAVDGVVDGDLLVVGGGDPLLASDWYPTSNLERRPLFNHTSLDTLADRVVAAGVTLVRGDVVGVGDRYDDEYFAPGWGNGVAGLEAGPYDALMANDSRVLGEDLKSNDPVAGAAREFARLLRDRGVVVEGSSVAAAPGTPTAGDEIAAIESVPLGDVVAEMLTNSDNNTAELLLKELGVAGRGEGSRTAGAAVVAETLTSWGVDVTGLAIADGSGLSLDNRLTCAALLAVLQRSGADGPLATGLPVAGETGTLDDVFTDHPLQGRLRGKTGTLNNPPFNVDPPAVKALAGYVPVEGGGAVEYALILNGPTISDQSEYRPIWDALADVLASYPSGPTPADLAPR